MQIHSLEIDDFEDINYTLLSVHTSLEDFKLSYLLNQKLNLFLSKSKSSLETEKNNEKSLFSVYEYQDDSQLRNWYLISNKHQGLSKKPLQNDLFGGVYESMTKTSYLIPEKKNTDYLLKIEGGFDSYSVRETIQSINNIQQISTSYSIDTTTLKSKDFLIF